MYVKYDSNNSGGHWWLTDDDWKNLEKAGWKVAWASLEYAYNDGEYVRDADGTPKLVPIGTTKSEYTSLGDRPDEHGVYRWLGAMATEAYRVGLPLRQAAEEWESITGKSSVDAGCPCCGQPHYFYEYDDGGNYVNCGPSTHCEASW